MIARTWDTKELQGHLQILSKVAYLYEQCQSWDKARSAYFAMISSIEEGESDWDSTFGHYDMMCPPPVETETKEVKQAKNSVAKREFYCHEYQKNECTFLAPHRAWVKNLYEMVEHFCFQCFKAKLGKQTHPLLSDNCPQRK